MFLWRTLVNNNTCTIEVVRFLKTKILLRAWPHQVVLGWGCGFILACGNLQSGQGAYPVRGTGPGRGPAPDVYVTEAPRTFIHCDSVRSHAASASRQAPTVASHAPAHAVPPTPPCYLPSDAPGFQLSAMEDATSRAIDAELRELQFG